LLLSHRRPHGGQLGRNSSGGFSGGIWVPPSKGSAQLYGRAGFENDPQAYAQRAFELSVAPYFFNPDRARDLTPFRVTGRTQQEVWDSLGEYDLRPALSRLSLPALVMQGRDDVIPEDSARTVAQLLGADLHLLPNCGHVPYVEALEDFIRLLDGFLPREVGRQ
jgi:pimeloyl-ACP methyl ester carboxylesterase